MITVFNKRFGPNGHKVLEMRGNLSRIYQCSNIYWGESINVYFSIFWMEGLFFMFGGFRILTFKHLAVHSADIHPRIGGIGHTLQ